MMNKNFMQLFIYLWVGAGATVVEWVIFYLFNEIWGIHYAWATTIAFAVSTLANWGLGRLMLFKKNDPKGMWHELLSIYAISVIGLLGNLLIMMAMIDGLHLNSMFSKIVATGIVFIANFLVRKFFIYKV